MMIEGDTARSILLEKLYRLTVGCDDRMQDHVECDESYVSEVIDVK
jgi:hypothetical protein